MLTRLSLAPCTTAPLGSLTVPEMLPSAAAQQVIARVNREKTIKTKCCLEVDVGRSRAVLRKDNDPLGRSEMLVVVSLGISCYPSTRQSTWARLVIGNGGAEMNGR